MSFPVTYPEQPALATVLRRQRDQFVQTVREPPVRDVPKALDLTVENELRNRLQGAPVDANPIGAQMYENFALTDDAVIFFIGQSQWTI
ncbi:hypothetical protein [Mycobacterium antarcticum]|uniref:hypothetical protein n=1 Tax=Mycolicibacterium sp. TUM20983 TaxID=3023369 RepID=UPI0024E0E879|nr:hypothetical protein [Mycolicibacterium sp. TUM20983]